jgi:hypothetical protein
MTYPPGLTASVLLGDGFAFAGVTGTYIIDFASIFVISPVAAIW